MKITADLNERLKSAVASVRLPGESVEVYWGNGGADEPHDAKGKFANEWDGSLSDIRTLRRWIEKHGPDTRTVTIYCRGDYREVELTTNAHS